MIKNERQYRITKSQATAFSKALTGFARQGTSNGDQNELSQRIQEDALRSQLEDLEAELREYERLRQTNPGVLPIHSFAELPQGLIKARIAAGISQSDLANRLSLKEQQVQRYEATDYAGASLSRIQQVIKALGLEVREEIFLPTENKSVGHVLKRLREAGLPRAFVEKRLVPKHLRDQLENDSTAAPDNKSVFALQLASAVGRIFNWTPGSIFGQAPLTLDEAILAPARFKKPRSADQRWTSVYTFYAHFLALLTLKCTEHIRQLPVDTNAEAVRDRILHESGNLSLEALINFIWRLGIPVLPLADPGTFHGACFRVNGRNVIVVKQNTTSAARWIVDILHEFRHAGEDPNAAEFTVVEETEILTSDQKPEAERVATEFAITVALKGHGEALITECVKTASGKVEWLKSACLRVAERHDVDVGVLANYLAYRLQSKDINWWPTAATFQADGDKARDLARRSFFKHVNLSLLNDLDRQLLENALQEVS
jgi:ribosome-binding protein aMBF1 (putative translation factor)